MEPSGSLQKMRAMEKLALTLIIIFIVLGVFSAILSAY